MARWIVFAMVAGLLVGRGWCEAKAPLEVGGFALGAPLQAVEDRVRMASALPVRHMEFLQEVEIIDLPQFKSGLHRLWDLRPAGADRTHQAEVRRVLAQVLRRAAEALQTALRQPQRVARRPVSRGDRLEMAIHRARRHLHQPDPPATTPATRTRKWATRSN